MRCQSRKNPLPPTIAAVIRATSLVVISALFAAACALTPGFPPPSGMAFRDLGKSAAGTPLAWSPDGRRLAVAGDGVVLVDLNGGSRRLLAGSKPSAIAWSPDGKRLAVASVAGAESILRLCPLDGACREARLEGRVESLFWPAGGEVLAVASKVTRYSFGVNVAALLYRWPGGDEAPSTTELFDTTLKKETLDYLETRAESILRADLSPGGDTLLYALPHDPPVFRPYATIVLYSLAGGAKRPVKEVSLAARGRFSGRGDQVLIADGEQTVCLDPATGAVFETWPWPGRTLAAAPGGERLLIDGHLLQGGGEIATLPPGAEGWFSPAGEGLLVRRGGRLFLLAQSRSLENSH